MTQNIADIAGVRSCGPHCCRGPLPLDRRDPAPGWWSVALAALVAFGGAVLFVIWIGGY